MAVKKFGSVMVDRFRANAASARLLGDPVPLVRNAR